MRSGLDPAELRSIPFNGVTADYFGRGNCHLTSVRRQNNPSCRLMCQNEGLQIRRTCDRACRVLDENVAA